MIQMLANGEKQILSDKNKKIFYWILQAKHLLLRQNYCQLIFSVIIKIHKRKKKLDIYKYYLEQAF